jgi:hypothetical protein
LAKLAKLVIATDRNVDSLKLIQININNEKGEKKIDDCF